MMRDIPSFEGLYAITKDGRIWSYRKPLTGACSGFRKGRWLKQSTVNGYKAVNLGNDNRNKSVHRLLAITYLPEIEGKTHVNHKDGIRSHNTVKNIEWCTRSENMLHAYRTGLSHAVKGLDESVIDDVKGLHRSGWTQVELGKKFGVGKSTIGRCLQGIGY